MININSTRKQRNQAFQNIIRELSQNRDTLQAARNAENRLHDKNMQTIRADFTPGSERLTKEIRAENSRHNVAMDKLKEDAHKIVFASLEALREDELLAVTVRPDAAVIEDLNIIGSMPLSAGEFEAVRRKYTTKPYLENYWTDRKLAEIARKNSIDVDTTVLDVEARISVIDEVASNFSTFIEAPADHSQAVSDTVLSRALSLFVDGNSDSVEADAKMIDTVMARLSKADVLEGSTIIRTTLKNCQDNAHRRIGLLTRLALSDYVTDAMLALAGDGILDSAKKYRSPDRIEALYNAEQRALAVRSADNKAEAIAKGLSDFHNSPETLDFYKATLDRMASNDSSFRKVLDEVTTSDTTE